MATPHYMQAGQAGQKENACFGRMPTSMPPTIVGRRVRVWWSVDQRWYEAKVLQYQTALGWQVRYEEAGVKWATATRWHNFAFEKWELVDEE